PAMGIEIAALVIVARDHVLFLDHRLEIDHGQIAARAEVADFVEHIGDAARHAGGEVASGGPEHDHHAAGHVFAAMVAGALDHRHRAGIAHRETLAGDAA